MSEFHFQNPKRQLRSQVQEYFTYRNSKKDGGGGAAIDRLHRPPP